MQRLPAQEGAKQQPVGFQPMSTLHQLPDRVSRPMQAHRVQEQIVRWRLQRERFVIADHCSLREPFPPELRETRDDGDGFKGSVNLDQSFLQFIRRQFLQEQCVGLGPLAVALKRCAVC